MKSKNSLIILFIFHFLIPFHFSACSSNYNDLQSQSIVTSDSLRTPSGNAVLDSLLQLAAVAPKDTNLALLWIDIGYEYYIKNNDLEQAAEYYFKTKALSEKLNFSEGRYMYWARYTEVLHKRGLTDSSIVIQKQALELAKTEKNEVWFCNISANLGLCYYIKGWYETALQHYYDALPIYETWDNKYPLANNYDRIGLVYGKMNLYNEMLTYFEKALEIYSRKPDDMRRAHSLINCVSALQNRKEYDKAEDFLLEAIRIATLHNSKYYLNMAYGNMAINELKKYNLDKAEMYYHKYLELAGSGDVNIEYFVNFGFANIELNRGNLKKSKEYGDKALQMALGSNTYRKKDCLEYFSYLYAAMHDFRNKHLYEQKTDSVRVEIVSEKTRQYAEEMSAKYETEKKELKITALEAEKRLMLWRSVAVGVVLSLALVAFFFLWRWSVQKKRLAEQQNELAETRIRQLEQEKQLIATQSLLDGETRERSRLARDLHDGLGSILAGAKLNLLEMKKGETPENASSEFYDITLALLDKSMIEMRCVAHHLMPEALTAVGLKQSTADFINSIPHATFAYYGDESRFDPKLEETIYRITHELVTNALKHSGARHIQVEIARYDDQISLTVQDDGCGFDPDAVSKGMGMNNIRTRVDAFGGTLLIDSSPDVGTEVNVEFTIFNSNEI